MRQAQEIEVLEAEVRYQRDRVALLRARLYRMGVGSNDRLERLQRELERAEHRLRDARGRPPTPTDAR